MIVAETDTFQWPEGKKRRLNGVLADVEVYAADVDSKTYVNVAILDVLTSSDPV